MSDLKKILNKYTGRHQLAVDPAVLDTFRDLIQDNAMGIAELDASGVNDSIISTEDGDWKKILKIQYNPVTEKINFTYEE